MDERMSGSSGARTGTCGLTLYRSTASWSLRSPRAGARADRTAKAGPSTACRPGRHRARVEQVRAQTADALDLEGQGRS